MSSSLEWRDQPVKYLRDKVVDQLKYNLSQDHLEMSEFEQLVKIAVSTKSKSELLSLVNDLPQKSEVRKISPQKELVSDIDKGTMISVFSESVRKGKWEPPKQLKVITVFGGAKIDFREAHLGPEIKYISIGCCFGGVDIIVPPGVNVVSNAMSVFGGIDNRSSGEIGPDSPTIIIDGLVVFGGVTIKVKSIGKKTKIKDFLPFFGKK